MRVKELKEIKHNIKIGEKCKYIEPNVKEDTLFTFEGQPVGFFIKKMPDKMKHIADIADKEFRSKNVPKSLMSRGVKSMVESKGSKLVEQYSTIIGSIPPKPHMRRNYKTTSSVHQKKSAQNFIKAMVLLCRESEKLIKEICPNVYDRQLEIVKNNVHDKWKFGELFTSSISNFNISAPYHQDNGNLKETVNVIITKRNGSRGGNLNVPDYGLTFDCCDNSMIVYPAWRNVHGVTPIIPTKDGGYRNSLVFYPLKGFEKE